MHWNVLFLIVVSLVQLSSSLYEDQIGKFDWQQQFIGKVKFLELDRSEQISRRIVVATEQNVLAMLNARNSQIVWRQIFEDGDQGRIDDMLVAKKYVITVVGGGESVRCMKTATGNLVWETSIAHSKHRARLALAETDGEDGIAVLAAGKLVVFQLNTGHSMFSSNLPESTTVRYLTLDSHGGELSAIGIAANSHFIITTYSEDGVIKAKNSIPAAWATDDTSCLVVAHVTLVCLDARSAVLHSLSLGKPTAFKSILLQDLGLSTLETPSIETFKEATEKSQEFLLRASPSQSAVLSVADGTVRLLKNLDGVTIAQVGQLGDTRVLLAISGSSPENLALKGYNMGTGEEMGEYSQTFPYPDHGTPEKMFVMLFHKKDGTNGFRILLTSQDHSLNMLHQSGKVVWTREESLSNIVSVEMVDLPLSKIQAEMEDFGSRGDDIFVLFTKRIVTQVTQLKTFLQLLKHRMFSPHHHHHHAAVLDDVDSDDDDGIDDDDDDDDDDDEYLTRDEFNLHKIIVTVTAAGKIHALDSQSGRILWQHFLPQMAPFMRFGRKSLLLYIQRTTAHFPNPPQGAVLGRHKVTGQGLLYIFNPITGKPVKDMPPGGEVINHEVLQVMLLSQMDDHYLRPIVLLDAKLQYHVYPASDLAMVRELAPYLYMYTADVITSTLTGYGMVVEDSKLLARELWSANLQQQAQEISHIHMKHPMEHVHSQGIVLADRSVLYKYLNPNLAVIVAEGVDSASKGFVNIYLIDTVTGSFVFHCHHRRSRGPVHIEHSENWVTYSYWNEKNRRTEMAVLELYEGKKQSNATTFSSLDPPPAPLVMRQAYIFPGYLSAIAVTMTEKGLTNKHLLTSQNNQVKHNITVIKIGDCDITHNISPAAARLEPYHRWNHITADGTIYHRWNHSTADGTISQMEPYHKWNHITADGTISQMEPYHSGWNHITDGTISQMEPYHSGWNHITDGTISQMEPYHSGWNHITDGTISQRMEPYHRWNHITADGTISQRMEPYHRWNHITADGTISQMEPYHSGWNHITADGTISQMEQITADGTTSQMEPYHSGWNHITDGTISQRMEPHHRWNHITDGTISQRMEPYHRWNHITADGTISQMEPYHSGWNHITDGTISQRMEPYHRWNHITADGTISQMEPYHRWNHITDGTISQRMEPYHRWNHITADGTISQMEPYHRWNHITADGTISQMEPYHSGWNHITDGTISQRMEPYHSGWNHITDGTNHSGWTHITDGTISQQMEPYHSGWNHITPVLKKLLWLPVKQCIHCPVLLLTFRAEHGLAPAYITDLLHEKRATEVLRSATNNDLYVPPSCSRYVDRTFSISAPRMWNALPSEMKTISCLVTFKRLLRTHLFQVAYAS
ncbi:ER membrane protein complex subunit 1 [Lamellibrachia satsuma]|nr:ER membrane protein complex subunit 1 [Lamellibrachia satsuma]